MKKKIGRYSHLIKYIVICSDLITICLLSFFILKINFTSAFMFYQIAVWFIISQYTDFYNVYRFTSIITINQRILKQFVLFFLSFYTYIGLFEYKIETYRVFYYFCAGVFVIFLAKFLIFKALKQFRLSYGGNKRHVIVLGNTKSSQSLVKFFNLNPEYGYSLYKIIEPDPETRKIDIEKIELLIQNNSIDEIYCSLKSIDSDQISTLFNLASNNFKTIKFIPDNHSLLLQKIELQHYGILPIIEANNFPLNIFYNTLIKRIFDIVFSFFIIVFLLSWLVPIIGLCIKLDSKGSVFFKQKRNGLNYKEFNCFKFRTLYVENEDEKYNPVTVDDKRITPIGKFLRQTSLDELPQFFNVFIGDMSVVGPRPHALIYNEEYTKKVDNFMVRHSIKPGITGMAQTHGYRGEIESDRDIINRLKYDVFYIKNWSLLLDTKIIIHTIFNLFKGDKKAY